MGLVPEPWLLRRGLLTVALIFTTALLGIRKERP